MTQGKSLLSDPILNRGTGFDAETRGRRGLRGLLPPGVETIEQQVRRVVANLGRKSSDLERYIYLMGLQDQNETLFYRVLVDHLETHLPIVYTPTVGQASMEYAHVYRRPRGLYITAEDRGSMSELLQNWPRQEVKVIVVTDGSRILGLGDLGANGMTIPIGKLALYTAAGGVDPSTTLPILLDVGTDNHGLREDPFYLGLRRPRLDNESYQAFMDEFMEATQRAFPEALIQFEDFATPKAISLLNRFQDRVRTFNDDIQGTAAVTVAGLLAGIRATERRLEDQTLLFVGAGSANTGIADLVVRAMVSEGLTEAEAEARCWFVDSKGLVVAGRERIRPHVARYAHLHPAHTQLPDIVEALRPTALIGATGQPGVFDESSIRAMAKHVERPLIFALSNPTSRAEATAEQVVRWSNGRALFAGGSPFAPVVWEGQTHLPGQSNNVYIFPGIGLAHAAVGLTRVTDSMFLTAARAVAEQVKPSRLAQGTLFPALSDIREVSLSIAMAVGQEALEAGLAERVPRGPLAEQVRAAMYWPAYA
ncbi:MAG: NAD-dependent malic enzyme [Myxococcota bacterium]